MLVTAWACCLMHLQTVMQGWVTQHEAVLPVDDGDLLPHAVLDGDHMAAAARPAVQQLHQLSLGLGAFCALTMACKGREPGLGCGGARGRRFLAAVALAVPLRSIPMLLAAAKLVIDCQGPSGVRRGHRAPAATSLSWSALQGL